MLLIFANLKSCIYAPKKSHVSIPGIRTIWVHARAWKTQYEAISMREVRSKNAGRNNFVADKLESDVITCLPKRTLKKIYQVLHYLVPRLSTSPQRVLIRMWFDVIQKFHCLKIDRLIHRLWLSINLHSFDDADFIREFEVWMAVATVTVAVHL